MNIGKHCDYCKQLDFLPFGCNFCSKTFCLKHKKPIDHNCPVKPEQKSFATNNKSDKFKGYRCSFCKCKELMEIRCMWCEELMCVRHRFPTDHKCTKQKKKLFHKQSVKNDIKRMDKRIKKKEKNCCIQ